MEIDWGPKHNKTCTLHQVNTSHGNNLNKLTHYYKTTSPGLELKEIDWGPKLPNIHVEVTSQLGVHYSSIFLYLQ